MKTKKIVSLLCAGAILATMLTGCANKTPDDANKGGEVTDAKDVELNETGDESNEKKEITLTVAASQNWIKDIDREIAEDFTAKTGIKIDFQVNPDDQYINVIKAKLNSGEAPDIIYTATQYNLDEYMPEKYFLDLSDEAWVDRYENWALTASTYNGKVMGLNTWGADTWAFCYNTQMFKEYDIQVPTNYNELIAVCETFKENGIQPIYMPAKELWYVAMPLLEAGQAIMVEDPDFYDKINNKEKALADVPEFVTTLERFKEMAEKGYFGENYMSDTWDKSYDVMGTGKAAMIMCYTAYTNEVEAKYPDSNASQWRMFPSVFTDNNTFSFSGGGEMRCINKDSQNIEAAKEYFNFLTEEENLNKYYNGRGDLIGSAFKGVEGKMNEAYASSLGSIDKFEIGLSSGVKFFSSSNYGQYTQEFLLGTKTAEEVLEAIDADRIKLLDINE